MKTIPGPVETSPVSRTDGRWETASGSADPLKERVYDPKGGRRPKHGGEFVFGDPAAWGEPDQETVTETTGYGTAHAVAFDRPHPRLTRRAAWSEHTGELPTPG